MEKEYNQKRIHPPIWQHDYHVLSRLSAGINRIIHKHLKKRKKGILLDYGCGPMPYKDFFQTFIAKYIGVDIGENEHADILIKEEEMIPVKKESVDIVLSTQVLEHIENVDFYLSECFRILKKNGGLILSTHGIWPYHPYPEDYHRWTKHGLNKALSKSGFEVVENISVLGSMASASQFQMTLIAQMFAEKGLLGKAILVFISVIANFFIWLDDRLYKINDEKADASVYLIYAQKR